jgi:hypothetical protein
MRVWTIQAIEVAEALSTGRIWRAREARAQRHWRHAYRWMREQMYRHLGPPTFRGQFPVWAWQEWRGRGRARPDLRCSGHLPRGTGGVRIELEIDPARLLLSDFELWHYVLNGWYLPRSASDERRHEAHVGRGLLEASWQRIFDLDWSHPRFASKRADKSVQGVAWELRPGDVRRIDRFLAR